MLFGIIIVLVAVAVAILLNKAKISKLVNQVEEAVAPAIEEFKEVAEKAAELAPKNETIKKPKEVAKKAPAKKSAKKSK
jgi:Sec-independent protein translocase protein TatA